MKRAMILVGLLLAAGFGLAQDQELVVETAESSQYGTYLVDGDGRTVYLFEANEPSMEVYTEGVRPAAAECTAECLDAWPPLDAPAGVSAAGAADSDLLYIENINGVNQAVYNGWPLYYFVRDEQPGQINGQEIESFGGEWYIVGPEGWPVEQSMAAAGGQEQAAEAGENGAGQQVQAEADREQTAAGGGEATVVAIRPLEDLRALLTEGALAGGPTPQTLEAFRGLQQSLGDGELAAQQTLLVAAEEATAALNAEPFDRVEAATALEELALTMRIVAGDAVPDEQSLLVEVASLLSQTAALYESENFQFAPRLEVDVP